MVGCSVLAVLVLAVVVVVIVAGLGLGELGGLGATQAAWLQLSLSTKG